MRELPHEQPLSGGNITGVVRVGETVRRACGPWSPAVHGLLQHLERQRFDGAPRFYGIDERGREILSFLPGEVGIFPYVWSTPCIVQAARLLRRLHDATLGYRPPAGAVWQVSYPDAARHEVICHNDFAPYNLVFIDQLPTAIIDFDTAGPGPRAWDLAYALYWFVPLFLHAEPGAPGRPDPALAAERIRIFCAAYGAPATPALLDMVELRLHALCVHLIRRALQGDGPYLRMIAEGHLAGYQAAIQDLRERRPALDALLIEALRDT